MLFQFAPAIQAKIDSGLYEVVRSQATGQLLGLARDKATGQFVGHAVNIVTANLYCYFKDKDIQKVFA